MHWEGEVDTKSHPNQEAICNGYLLGREVSLPQESVIGFISHSTEQAPGPAIVSKHKMDSVVLFFLLPVCLAFVLLFCLVV